MANVEILERLTVDKGGMLSKKVDYSMLFFPENHKQTDYKITTVITTVITSTSFWPHPHFRARTVHHEHTHMQK